MSVAIRETIVTPATDHDVVQLRISDVPNDGDTPSFQLTMHAKLRPLLTPTLAHLQRDAITKAQETLNTILKELERNLQGHGNPPPRRS